MRRSISNINNHLVDKPFEMLLVITLIMIIAGLLTVALAMTYPGV